MAGEAPRIDSDSVAAGQFAGATRVKFVHCTAAWWLAFCKRSKAVTWREYCPGGRDGGNGTRPVACMAAGWDACSGRDSGPL